MNNDLSDEAFWEWHDKRGIESKPLGLLAWQESRRRVIELLSAYEDHIASPNECTLIREIKKALIGGYSSSSQSCEEKTDP